MSPHFAAFSFVDRITEFEPGRRAVGRFAVPGRLAGFSPCLVAEAVGQLAAWASMAHIGFRGRPVAALATETILKGAAVPGRDLDLAVDLQACDDDAVAYCGTASVGGTTIIELVDCLGPMLPVADFDAPEALAARLELLRGDGAPPGRFEGVTLPAHRTVESVPGASAQATLAVPVDLPAFGDHFPRRPVFPATLLLDCQMRLALEVARGASPWKDGAMPTITRITHVKMRSFIAPGASLVLGVELGAPANGVATARLSARIDERVVATARMEIAA